MLDNKAVRTVVIAYCPLARLLNLTFWPRPSLFLFRSVVYVTIRFDSVINRATASVGTGRRPSEGTSTVNDFLVLAAVALQR